MPDTKPSENPATNLPHFIYGTGSDYDEQHTLVQAAVRQGYHTIDTGPTPAYRENLTAHGIRQARCSASTLGLQDIFIQTKISAAERYQDAKSVPFEESDTPYDQVMKSFSRSQMLFRGSGGVIKLLLLHAPFENLDLTMEYWSAMEYLVDTVEDLDYLGVCNVKLDTLTRLYSVARVKPVVVQNSFRPASAFDADIIRFCRQQGLIYQAYSVLVSNVDILSTKLIGWFAAMHGISEAQALFLFVLSFGRGTIRILHASRDLKHMAANLSCLEYLPEISEEMLEAFEQILGDLTMVNPQEKCWSY
jgi:diketogulonate reductase-like aldo/keto reductase